jgi:hypothetical protein
VLVVLARLLVVLQQLVLKQQVRLVLVQPLRVRCVLVLMVLDLLQDMVQVDAASIQVQQVLGQGAAGQAAHAGCAAALPADGHAAVAPGGGQHAT